ncbi:MAG TPA: T9SS type A sorting domain-containing protein [Rubricoccaceae bacterium]|nr:T9SS type A sorting domain-containing protein [Rubricoccaceae bacterium]
MDCFRYALVGIGLLAAAPAHAQLPFALGSGGFDDAFAVDVGPGGLLVVGGAFEETVDFDPGPDVVTRTAVGFDDAYVAAYASDGSFAWVVALGSGSTDVVNGVASDSTGDVYVTGHFSGPVDFDPGPGTFTLTPQGSQAVFVASYNTDGSFRWAFALGDEDFNYAGDIAVDRHRVFVTGGVEGTSDFDPGPGTHFVTANSGEDAFLASYTVGGAFRWAFNIGTAGSGADFDEGADVTARDGHVWATGMFSSAADFQGGPGEVILNAGDGFNDVYVARYAADGPATGPAFEWGFGIGDESFDGGFGIAVDDALNTYVTGFFRGTADFDPGGATEVLTSAGQQDAFVARYGVLGGFHWAFPLGSGAFETGNDLVVRDGALYVGGSFGDTVDFDPGAGTSNQTAIGFDDFFVARYTTGGSGQRPALVWVNHAGAVESAATVNELALSPFLSGVFAVGTFEGTMDVDPGPGEVLLTEQGLGDGFVLRYADDGTLPSSAEDSPEAPVGFALSSAYPNPFNPQTTLTLTVGAAQTLRVAVVDALGREVALLHEGPVAAGPLTLTFDAATLPSGVYLVRAVGPRGTASRAVTLAR